MVDFDVFAPEEGDFHGIRALLASYLDDEAWDVSSLADVVIKSGAQVGSVVKAGDEGYVMGVISCLPLVAKVGAPSPASSLLPLPSFPSSCCCTSLPPGCFPASCLRLQVPGCAWLCCATGKGLAGGCAAVHPVAVRQCSSLGVHLGVPSEASRGAAPLRAGREPSSPAGPPPLRLPFSGAPCQGQGCASCRHLPDALLTCICFPILRALGKRALFRHGGSPPPGATVPSSHGIPCCSVLRLTGEERRGEQAV